MKDTRTRWSLPLALAILCLLMAPGPARAIDEENCLMCHRHRGLSYIDEAGDFRLLYVSEPVYDNSPHGLFACTDCHEDIDRIPHTGAGKVNCLKTCHIENPTLGNKFTHAEVAEVLAGSVHSPVDEFGREKPFPEDYPTCKTCHQDPLYRPLQFFKHLRPGVSEKIMNRCLVCHDDPDYVKKFYSHFSSRMQKGRNVKEVVRMCGHCHEDQNFIERHDLDNVVYSYWETYHGKAAFFGNELVPDCLDCHAGFTGSVHSMHAADDPQSTVHPDNRYITCANIDCHPSADPKLADYKVHMLADRDRHPFEYYVSAFFVTLTLLSFIPIMLALILDVIRSLFPGNTVHENRPLPPRPIVAGVELGPQEPLIEVKKGKRYFRHLTLNQRWQHIAMMLSFAGLALTGLPMKYFHVDWVERLYLFMGGIPVATVAHRVCAIVMGGIFLYHFVYIAVTYITYYMLPLVRAGKLNVRTFVQSFLCLPMIPNLEDLREVWLLNKYRLFFTNVKPAAGRFTLKEKFGYFAVFWGVPVIGLSGLMLWGEELFSPLHFTKHFLTVCLIAHSDEALLASIVIFLWHIYNTHLKRGNFPMGLAWFTGNKDEHEILDDHYGYYLGAVAKEGQSPAAPHPHVSPARRVFARGFDLVMLLFLTASTGFLCWLVFNTVFGYHMIAYSRAPKHEHLTKPQFLQEVVLDGETQKTFYRGFRIVEEQEIGDHYHNIALNVGPDNRSHCIACHGDFPHGKTDQIRSYLNMHAFFLACQTCHVRPGQDEQPYTYQWYNRETGQVLKETPDLGIDEIDRLGIKLIPGEQTPQGWKRIDSDEAIAFARTFIEQADRGELRTEEKKQTIDTIHRRVSKESITCRQCHSPDESFLPYRQIGYSPERLERLLSDDIVSMIRDYDLFVFPSFLERGK